MFAALFIGMTYWGDEQTKKLIEWRNADEGRQRNRIFEDSLYEYIRRIAFVTAKPNGLSVEEGITHVWGILDKIDVTKGNPYSFISVSLINFYNGFRKQAKGKTFEELDPNLREENQGECQESLSIDFAKARAEIPRMFSQKRSRAVASAILDIMEAGSARHRKEYRSQLAQRVKAAQGTVKGVERKLAEWQKMQRTIKANGLSKR